MNLPNKLTMLRVILVPFMMFFYLATFIPYGIGKVVALIIFGVSALTDLFDGKIARKYNLITNFGKFLDPLADKVLTTAALILFIADGTILNPYGAIILTIIITREFAVSGLRLLAATKGRVLAADIWGKAKTMTQMVAIPVFFILAFLFGLISSGVEVVSWLVVLVEVVGYTLLIAATILTVMSGINYIVKNKDCFKED